MGTARLAWYHARPEWKCSPYVDRFLMLCFLPHQKQGGPSNRAHRAYDGEDDGSESAEIPRHRARLECSLP